MRDQSPEKTTLPRRIVQVAVSVDTRRQSTLVLALADDNSLWSLDPNSFEGWKLLPELPRVTVQQPGAVLK